MKKQSTNELRKAFLDFFSSKEHLVLPSASLVPKDDPTLLWINSGVATLKPYFSGQQVPPNPRLASSQKSVRTNDIENVGRTARHHTLFEMLGNFSVGDYFKKEAIEWAWEFLIEVIGFDPNDLYISVHPEDEEALNIWHEEIGIPLDRIVKLSDNFWDIGPGPCGPNSEIFFDRGPTFSCGSAECQPGCDCDRYLEFWNLVFSQFNHNDDGTYTPLPRKNIDTGMGLERLVSLVQGTNTNYGTDLFMPYINYVEKLTGEKYDGSASNAMAMNVIADHIRAVTFAIGDGAAPSNEGRGYVIRRLLRRAVRYGRTLGLREPFLFQIVPVVAKVMNEAYPELGEKVDFIQRIVRMEEERFLETLDEGTQMLTGVIRGLRDKGETSIDGLTAFKLYDTFGFPLDLTDDIAREQGFVVDRQGFTVAMEAQRDRARAARHDSSGEFGKINHFPELTPTVFKGFSDTALVSRVVGLLCEGEKTDTLATGDRGAVILNETPFYAEAGGQVGDGGELVWQNGLFKVENTVKYFGDLVLHTGTVIAGKLEVSDQVAAQVDCQKRSAVARAHTATHLVHTALRSVLGAHATQSGSLVEPDRLRFDFSHFSALTADEIQQIEAMVNREILASHMVATKEVSLAEASQRGATSLFGEKYGDTVRMVEIGEYSLELCGGTHLHSSAEVGLFALLGESGIGAGLRRIEGITGHAAYERVKHVEKLLNIAADKLKTTVDEVPRRIEIVLQQAKDAERQVAKLNSRLVSLEASEYVESASLIDGVRVIARKISASDMDSLRLAADSIKDKMGSGVLVLGAVHDDKVSLVAFVSDDLLPRGLHAGNLIREVAKLTGGGGGGRPNMAQAGGKDPARLSEALDAVTGLVKLQLRL